MMKSPMTTDCETSILVIPQKTQTQGSMRTMVNMRTDQDARETNMPLTTSDSDAVPGETGVKTVSDEDSDDAADED